MRTLWDLIPKRRAAAVVPVVAPVVARPVRSAGKGASAARYEAVARLMLSRYGVRVRKWRSGTSGVAWQLSYADGRVARLIEAPRPRGPISAAVFLHEIGHHAIGFGTYRPRCLEEYYAWRFALERMREHGLNITPRVHARVDGALRYAVAKARRRGLKVVPVELRPYDGVGPVTPIDLG